MGLGLGLGLGERGLRVQQLHEAHRRLHGVEMGVAGQFAARGRRRHGGRLLERGLGEAQPVDRAALRGDQALGQREQAPRQLRRLRGVITG